MRHALLLLPLAAAMAACTPPATNPPAEEGPRAQAPAPAGRSGPSNNSGTFVLLRGADTVAVERFNRTEARLQAELRIPQQVRVAYTADLNPDASVSRFEVRAWPATSTDTTPAQISTATFVADSVILEGTRGGQTTGDRRQIMATGVVAYVNPSPSLLEQVVRRARRMGGELAQVPVFASAGGGQTVTASVHFAGDSAHVSLAGVALTLRVDPQGAVLGGTVPSQNLLIQRLSTP